MPINSQILLFSGTKFRKLNSEVFQEKDENGDLIGTWCLADSKPHEAICCICNIVINCSNHGVTAVKRHAKSAKHIEKCNKSRKEDGTLKKPSQLRFSSDEKNHPAKVIMLSQADRTLSAEILFAFSVASSNVSYKYGDVASKLFPKMFSDSQIAKDFSCRRKKLSYIISDGIGIHIKNELVNEIVEKGSFYSVQLDETPIPEKRTKQLDINIRYYSETQQEIIAHHIESFHIGCGDAEILFEKLQEAILKLPAENLINVFSDGPNVMKTLKKKVQTNYSNVLDIGTCNLHVIHNGFLKGLENFGEDVEELIIDLYYLFKRSAKQSEELKELQIKFGMPEHVLLRHVNSRWLTLNLSVQRLIEQFSVLKVFFSGKKEIKADAASKIKKICQAFASPTLLSEALFLRNVTNIFIKSQKLFQKDEPLIHILYDEHEQLLRTLMGRFLKHEYFSNAKDLTTVSIEKGEHWLEVSEVGADTELELRHLTKNDRKTFYLGARSFYINCTKYLLKKLPLQNRLLKNLKFLHPLFISEPSSVNCLKTVLSFTKFIPSERVSALVDEWLHLQTENLENNIMELKNSATSEPLENEDVDDDEEKGNCEDFGWGRIDHFWTRIFQIKNSNNCSKYPLLSNLVKALLTFPHGNADCERGFSINNALLEGRSNLSIQSINGLRQIKSHMKRLGDFDKLKINRDLLNAAKNSRQAYQSRLDKEKKAPQVKRKVPDDVSKLQEAVSEENELQNKLSASQTMLTLAENHIAEGIKKKDMKLIESGQVLLKEAKAKIPIITQKIKENKESQLKLQEQVLKKRKI